VSAFHPGAEFVLHHRRLVEERVEEPQFVGALVLAERQVAHDAAAPRLSFAVADDPAGLLGPAFGGEARCIR